MPAEISIDVSDLIEAASDLGQAERIARTELTRAHQKAGFFGQRFLAKYPSQSYRPARFKSKKQRRYFFWALNAGIIKVPYERTGSLGRGWTSEVRATSTSIRTVLGNVRPHAPIVQDEDRQSYHHRGRWPTVQQVAERTPSRRIRQFIEDAVERIIHQLSK